MESTHAKWHDIDFKRGIIYLLNTKNGEKREIPINEQIKTTLKIVRRHPGSLYLLYNADGSFYGDIKKSFSTALKKAVIINSRCYSA